MCCYFTNVHAMDSSEKFDVRALARAVYGANYSKSVGGRNSDTCTEKWQKPFKFLVQDPSEVLSASLYARFYDDVNSVMPQWVDDSSRHQIEIKIDQKIQASFDDSDSYKALCSAQRLTKSGCEIIDATIVLPGNLDEPRMAYCLYHEFMHTIGFQGHIWSVESILNPNLDLQTFSVWDQIGLQFLYDEKIKSNLSPGQVLKIWRQRKP